MWSGEPPPCGSCPPGVGVDHAPQVAAVGQQPLQIFEADLVVAGPGAKSVILHGDGHPPGSSIPNGASAVLERAEIDVPRLDDDRPGGGA